MKHPNPVAADGRSPEARLAELRRSPEGVPYCTEVPLGGQKEKRISILANCMTGETFVVVTDGRRTRVRSFFSRHRNCPPEARRKDMPLVDMADAFALARKMCCKWLGQSGHGPEDPSGCFKADNPGRNISAQQS